MVGEEKKEKTLQEAIKKSQEFEKELDEKLEEKTEPKEGEIKEFGDVFEGGELLEGEQLEVLDVFGKEIILRNYIELAGSEEFGGGTFYVIQATFEDRLVTFATGSKVLKAQLKAIKDKLPVRATIKKPAGKRYYTFA